MRAWSRADTLVPCACTIDTHGSAGRNGFLSKQEERRSQLYLRSLSCAVFVHTRIVVGRYILRKEGGQSDLSRDK